MSVNSKSKGEGSIVKIRNRFGIIGLSKEDMFLWLGIFLLSVFSMILLLLFSSLGGSEILRMILGSVLVLFLPGYVTVILFFKSSEIDVLEKIGLSFAFSIVFVPLLMFYLNLIFGFGMSMINVFVVVLLIIIVLFAVRFALNLFAGRKHKKHRE